MKKIICLAVLFSIIGCLNQTEYPNCETTDPLEDLTWLKQIKTSFEQSTDATKKKIIQYTYKNEFVFLIDACVDCPDNLIIVYDCNGSKICEFGGIAGLNTCPDFEQNETTKIILWEN